ncbi:hypothetical protein D3C86_1455780 [compost metagenome]
MRPAALPVMISRAAGELGVLRVTVTAATASSAMAIRSMPLSIRSSCCVPALRISGRWGGVRTACVSAALVASGQAAWASAHKAISDERSSDGAPEGLLDGSHGV